MPAVHSEQRMDLTILICTYNRADEIKRTLDTMADIRMPPEVSWEVLVVDNNSPDATRDVVSSFTGTLPIRYIFEKTQGKSNALNRGIREARGALVALIDDDVDVTPDWAYAYHRAAREHPDAGFFGGRVHTLWVSKPPKWMSENLDWIKSVSRYDQGNEGHYISGNKHLFIGANMAFRKSVFDTGHQFNPDFGPLGDSRHASARHGGEEGEFEERLMDAGIRGYYVPDSLVYHRERPYRMTRKYLRWYSRETGREARSRDGLPVTRHYWFGIPRYLWRDFFAQLLKFIITRFSWSSRVWLPAECVLARTIGDMQACRTFFLQKGQRNDSYNN